MQQYIRPVDHFADVKIQRRPFDPLYEENRKSLATDEYSFRCVSELRKVRDRRRPEMFLNGAVSLIAVSEIATKTAHCEVASAIRLFQFVDIRKLARRHERHSQPIDGSQRLAQMWMRKTDRGTLDRFGKIPGGRAV